MPIDTTFEEERICFGSQDCYFATNEYCEKHCCRIERDICYEETFKKLDELSKTKGKKQNGKNKS